MPVGASWTSESSSTKRSIKHSFIGWIALSQNTDFDAGGITGWRVLK
jgi:hypothetical protein